MRGKFPKRKTKILLCPDQPEWAFDNIARNIARYAPSNYEISVHYMGRPGERDLAELVGRIIADNIDVLHIFWREDLFELLRPETLIDISGRLGMSAAETANALASRALTTSVYDHLLGNPSDLEERAEAYHLIDGYTVSSQRLFDQYGSQRRLPPPDALTPDGVDTDHFTPGEAGRLHQNGPLRIGWVGNSRWGASVGNDPKGFRRLMQPAIEILRGKGMNIDLRLADPNIKRIPFADMPDFYRDLDILACTSAMEGTPNPVLEAMASAVPVVSTDVGILPQLFGPQQSEYLLRDPDPRAFANAIEMLANDLGARAAIATENRQRALCWTWEETTRAWWPFWTLAVERASDPRLARRRATSLEVACSLHYVWMNGDTQKKRFGAFWRRQR